MRIFLSLTITFIAASITGAQAARLETDSVYSVSMKKQIPTDIILPYHYGIDDTVIFYPVIYLLHGYSGSFESYPTRYPRLLEMADSFNIIFVCPDGGYSSWYVDSPIDTAWRYETFVSKELVGYIDSHFTTRAHRTSRAICGLSMGGHGALLMALKHPDVFGAAGSMSGCVDLTYDVNGWQLAERLGDFSTHQNNWVCNSVNDLVCKCSCDSTALIVDCGTKDMFININRAFNHELDSLHIAHTYHEYEGAHDWTYWAIALPVQIRFFDAYFRRQKN